MNKDESLKLENQLCFPLYAASRLVTRCYQPLLDQLGLTYPQYLVLLVLWETDKVNLKVLSDRLELQSNTLTPLLKRMEDTGIINRTRSTDDERSIIVSLTEKGRNLKLEAPKVHSQLVENIGIDLEDAQLLHQLLYKVIKKLKV
jgi:DNA-binding MarR family transcriptional regulator